MTFRGFRAFLQSRHFDAIGFRCYSRDHNYMVRHTQIAREAFPEALILVGGPHPSALPECVLGSMPNVDFAWKAEAEEGMPMLLSASQRYGRNIPDEWLAPIPGLVWRSAGDGSIRLNPVSFSV